MQPSTATPPDEAAEILESLRAAREAADQRLPTDWFARVVVGLLLFASSFLWVFWLWDGASVALFWLATTPVALFAIKRHKRAELRTRGAVRNARAHLLATGWFIVACVLFGAVGGAIGEPTLINVGPMVVMATVYAVIAWRDRSAFLAWWWVGFTALYFGCLFVGLEDPARIYALVRGGNLAIDGWRDRKATV